LERIVNFLFDDSLESELLCSSDDVVVVSRSKILLELAEFRPGLNICFSKFGSNKLLLPMSDSHAGRVLVFDRLANNSAVLASAASLAARTKGDS
jgi:hypothetical protein